MTVSVYQQGGYGTAPLFPNPIIARRDPASTDRVSPTGAPYPIFQFWNNELTDTNFMYLGSGNWVSFASVVGAVSQLTSDAGVAVPAAGNINVVGGAGVTTSAAGSTLTIALTGGGQAIDSFVPDAGTNPVVPTALGAVTMAGTANQITTTGGLNTLTFSIPAVFIAPGSITSTTTITAGTGLTVTAGDATVSAGNIVATLGNITASAGNIAATVGSVSAGTSVTAGTTVTATLGAITATNGNLVLGTAGNKLSIATGANASVGTETLAGGTATVLTTAVTASSIILLTRQSIGATGAAALGLLTVGTVTPGTSFVINAVSEADATALAATDVSVIGWVIIN